MFISSSLFFRTLALILVLDKIKIILGGENKKNNTTTNKLTDSIASKQEELENEMKTDIKYTFKQNWEGKKQKEPASIQSNEGKGEQACINTTKLSSKQCIII